MISKESFSDITTPFYYYDTQLLQDTLDTIKKEMTKHPRWSVHYAVKANANSKVLEIIARTGLGADCVQV